MTGTHYYNEQGNCDIDFFNFPHCQVQNLKKNNQFNQTKILRSTFESTKKRKRKSTKYIKLNKAKYYTKKFC
jgi:hypothetical protein